jgi:hypothetical protein
MNAAGCSSATKEKLCSVCCTVLTASGRGRMDGGFIG